LVRRAELCLGSLYNFHTGKVEEKTKFKWSLSNPRIIISHKRQRYHAPLWRDDRKVTYGDMSNHVIRPFTLAASNGERDNWKCMQIYVGSAAPLEIPYQIHACHPAHHKYKLRRVIALKPNYRHFRCSYYAVNYMSASTNGQSLIRRTETSANFYNNYRG